MVKSIKEIRKAKGFTLETLSKLCGVSAKTILQYEHEPPQRPSQKVVEKLSKALDLSPDELLRMIKSPGKARGKAGVDAMVELSDEHISSIRILIEKEIRELQLLLLDYAELQEQHPALNKAMDYLSNDINLLTEIKGFFA